MSYPAIHRFVDKVRGLDMSSKREFVMSSADAKALNAEITKLLLNLETSKKANSNVANDMTQNKIEIRGEDF